MTDNIPLELVSNIFSFFNKNDLETVKDCDLNETSGHENYYIERIIINSLQFRLINKTFKYAFEKYTSQLYNYEFNEDCTEKSNWFAVVKHMNEKFNIDRAPYRKAHELIGQSEEFDYFDSEIDGEQDIHDENILHMGIVSQEAYILFNDISNELKEKIKTYESCIKSEINSIYPLSLKLQKRIINDFPLNLGFIKNQSERVCLMAVRLCGYALKHVENQTKRVLDAAVETDGLSIYYYFVNNRSCFSHEFELGLYMKAVKRNGRSLKFMDFELLFNNPEYMIAILKEAVSNNGVALEYFEEKYQKHDIFQTEEGKNGLMIKHVASQHETLCIAAVQNNYKAIEFIKKRTREINITAVKKNGLALQYIDQEEQDLKLCKMAVKNNADALQYVKNQNDWVCRAAVMKDGMSLHWVEKKMQWICELAVKQSPNALQFVNDQDVDICFKAMMGDYNVLSHVSPIYKEVVMERLIWKRKNEFDDLNERYRKIRKE